MDKYDVTKNRTEYNNNSSEDVCVGANHDVGKYTPVIGVGIIKVHPLYFSNPSGLGIITDHTYLVL